jgi:transglutaminase-like putative cysteine protease
MNAGTTTRGPAGVAWAWGVALALHAVAFERVVLCLISAALVASVWWSAGWLSAARAGGSGASGSGTSGGSASDGGAGWWGGVVAWLRAGEWSWWRVLAAGGVGALLGWLLPIEVATSGPLSLTVLSLLTGGVLGVGTWGALSGRALPTGLCALGLAALSGQLFPTPGVARAFDLFVLSWVLLGVIWSGTGRAWLHRRGGWSVAGAMATLAIAGWLTLGFEQRVRDWEEPFLGWLQGWLIDQPRDATGGASRDLVLAARGNLELSERPVFELSRRPERVRTRVFDQYDGTRFSTSAELRTLLRPLSELTDPGVPSRELEFVACETPTGLIPAPGGTWGAEEFVPRVDGGQVLSTTTPTAAGRLRYDPREWLLTEPEPGDDLTLVPPALAGPLGELAGAMLGGEADPRRQAERLEQYFHEQFTYSLQTDLAGPEHPLLILLRERRPASCTYFAAAYTLLLRTRGVPARVVTGYLSPPVNRLTGGVTLREIDAHAWAEVYLASEQRWVGFDPTPADSRQAVYAPVQGGGWWGEVWGAVTVWARRAWLAWRRDPLGATARGMIWPLGGLLLGWLGWRVGRRLGTRRSRPKVGGGLEADDPVLRASRREFEASLGRLGLLVDPTESDEERLQRLAGMTSVEVCARAGRFLEQYHAARFGGREPTADLLAQARLD